MNVIELMFCNCCSASYISSMDIFYVCGFYFLRYSELIVGIIEFPENSAIFIFKNRVRYECEFW